MLTEIGICCVLFILSGYFLDVKKSMIDSLDLTIIYMVGVIMVVHISGPLLIAMRALLKLMRAKFNTVGYSNSKRTPINRKHNKIELNRFEDRNPDRADSTHMPSSDLYTVTEDEFTVGQRANQLTFRDENFNRHVFQMTAINNYETPDINIDLIEENQDLDVEVRKGELMNGEANLFGGSANESFFYTMEDTPEIEIEAETQNDPQD